MASRAVLAILSHVGERAAVVPLGRSWREGVPSALRDRPGVYVIVNTVNGKPYVGSATKLRYRANLHLYELRRGQSPCALLQRAVDKYGLDKFVLVVLVACERSLLRETEQALLDTGSFFSPCGYNIARDAKVPGRGRCVSDETRAKMRAAASGRKIPAEVIARQQASRVANGRSLGPLRAAQFAAGWRYSEASRAKMSTSAKRYWASLSPEEKQEKLASRSSIKNIRKAMLGSGWKTPDASRQKMSVARKAFIARLSTDELAQLEQRRQAGYRKWLENRRASL